MQCEACHGLGSNRIPNPAVRDIFVGVCTEDCGKCHTQRNDPNPIAASRGYKSPYSQWPELRASGAHANITCTTCHDPPCSTRYEIENAIRNDCTTCQQDQDLAIHEGLSFVRGNYMESLSCVSCHMPLATHSASSASEDVVGLVVRSGDTKTHIFRINPNPDDDSSLFNMGGTAVDEGGQGRATATLDFVCFRCHNGIGNAGEVDSLDLATGVPYGVQSIGRPKGKSIFRSED